MRWLIPVKKALLIFIFLFIKILVFKIFNFLLMGYSHTLVRINRKIPCNLYPVSSNGNILQKYTVEYHNQDTT